VIEMKLLKLGIGYNSKKADKDQDNYFIYNDTISTIIGVFDGHGTYGHFCSHFAQQLILKFLLTSIYYESDPITALKESFAKTDEALRILALHQRIFSALLSGTTATILLRRGEHLYIANVGDSRAIMSIPSKEIIRLSNDHSPDVNSEKERIEAAGGNIFSGPHKRLYFGGENYPTLALSRVLGDDIYKAIGVISEPETSERKLESTGKIIIATDGVWEFLKDNEVANIAQRTNASKAALNIVNEAHSRWMKFNKEVADDITCIVYNF